MSYTYPWPRPGVTADSVVLGSDPAGLHLLLIRRAQPPFKGRWCLPGGFVEMGESLEKAARRELLEETGVRLRRMEQLHAFGAPRRDPRTRVISVAFCALVQKADHLPRGGDDASHAAWVPIARVARLGFDHDAMLELALRRLGTEGPRLMAPLRRPSRSRILASARRLRPRRSR